MPSHNIKLFLASFTLSPTQAQALAELAGKPASEIKLLLIENAADPYPEDHRAWVDSARDNLKSHGFQVTLFDLRTDGQLEALESSLSISDVVWLGGGNTFYLRWLLRKTGADQIITKMVRSGKLIYGGSSAGAIMTGPTLKFFEAADDPKDAPELLLDGLGLIDTMVVPHFSSPKYGEIITGINNKLRDAGFKTTPITDQQVLVVDGDRHTVI